VIDLEAAYNDAKRAREAQAELFNERANFMKTDGVSPYDPAEGPPVNPHQEEETTDGGETTTDGGAGTVE